MLMNNVVAAHRLHQDMLMNNVVAAHRLHQDMLMNNVVAAHRLPSSKVAVMLFGWVLFGWVCTCGYVWELNN